MKPIKRKTFGYLMMLLGLALACSRDSASIWINLERPMYNRFQIRLPGGKEPVALDLAPGDQTTIFDTERMTSVTATVRGGDVQHRRSRFRIALVDYNNNGKFNERELDLFLLEKYGRDSSVLIYPLQPNMGRLEAFTQFRVDRQFFEIAHVDPQGHTLEIFPIGRSNALHTVVFNTHLPNLQIRDSLGQHLRLGDLREPGKPLVIVLWQNRHHVWDYQVEELLLHHQMHPDRMKIIGLHVPEPHFRQPDLVSIQAWLKGRMPLYWGESEHHHELNCSEKLPNIVLFDAQGEWQGSGLRAKDVVDFLTVQH